MKDAYYFPHFSNARHDRKIKRLVKELGIEGYGIFFMLLEILREQLDFRYPLADIDLLSDEIGTSEAKIKVVVCNYQLFEIDTDQMFFSPKLLLYLQPYLQMREQRRIAGIASGKARRAKALSENDSNDRSTTVQASVHGCSNENEQSKVEEVKEIRVKEIEENKSKEIKGPTGDDVLEFPDWLPRDSWSAYVEMRKGIKKPLKTQTAIKLAIAKLSELRSAGNDPGKVLEQSIFNSWQGLFAIKKEADFGHTRGGKQPLAFEAEKPRGKYADVEKFIYTDHWPVTGEV